jgi:hypothetical protein
MSPNTTSEAEKVSSSSNETCDQPQLIIYTTAAEVVFSAMYLVIFCLGVAGNALVSLAVTRSRHMRTVTNLFILNLAVR